MVVGILALQGGFSKHAEILESIGVESISVRYPKELSRCDALIIPGGESTTITKRMDEIDLKQAIIDFSQEKSIFGTCAGLIMMAGSSGLGILDVEIQRNAYGTQYDSFSAEVDVSIDGKDNPFHAVFIRAPIVEKIGSGVEILASYNGRPIIVRQGRHLGATFHPELTGNSLIHRYFLRR